MEWISEKTYRILAPVTDAKDPNWIRKRNWTCLHIRRFDWDFFFSFVGMDFIIVTLYTLLYLQRQ